MASDRLIEELLVRGADDWLMAADVAWLAQSEGGAVSDDAIRELSLDLIRTAVAQGLMEIGDVTDGGFFGWDHLPRAAAIDEVERRWRSLGRRPNIGDVCWLANTPSGDARAAEVIKFRRRCRQDEPRT